MYFLFFYSQPSKGNVGQTWKRTGCSYLGRLVLLFYFLVEKEWEFNCDACLAAINGDCS